MLIITTKIYLSPNDNAKDVILPLFETDPIGFPVRTSKISNRPIIIYKILLQNNVIYNNLLMFQLLNI